MAALTLCSARADEAPAIISATIDYTGNQVTITGANFSPTGAAPTVAIDSATLALVSFTNERAAVSLPAVWSSGSYLLAITNSSRLTGVFRIALQLPLDKLRYHARAIYGPFAVAGNLAYAGVLQELNAPKEWGYGWAAYGRRVPPWEDLFAQLEHRIARNPKTTFISVHFGNAAEYPERVAAMLDKYPNMYVDTAARIPEMGRYDAQKMHDLITRHADRILFGTDLGVGPEPQQLMLGSTGATPPTPEDTDHFFHSSWRYFETWDRTFRHPTPIQGRWPIDGVGLEPGVLKKLYWDNAARLLGLP